MKFDDLDRRMRVFETAHDHSVLPGIYMVARLDGRGFTKLTKEVHSFEAPFDAAFRDHMAATTHALMQCGFRVSYGYTQSDEISLLFHPDENAFGRKLRKYNSVLAGEASAAFSIRLGAAASFDCRISQLPASSLVVDYFRWRQEDAYRNSLNAHCYWALRREGYSAQEATGKLHGKSVADKNRLLHGRSVNFNKLPTWQKRGIGLYWSSYEKMGRNPATGRAVMTHRRAIQIDEHLPLGENYDAFILDRIAEKSS